MNKICNEPELKPCHFCGGKVSLMNLFTPIPMFYCMNTQTCGAVVSFDNPQCNHDKYNKFKVMAWNRREEAHNEFD